MSSANKGEELKKLIKKYVTGRATPEEINFLNLYFEEIEKMPGVLNELSESEIGVLRDQVFRGVEDRINNAEQGQGKVARLNKAKTWLRAAVVIGLMAAAGLWYFNYRDGPLQDKHHDVLQSVKADDILPGGDKAVLTLADGSKIILDSAGKGLISQQDNVKVLKVGSGEISYEATGKKADEVLYNSISTPRGGQYQVTLPDGTMVWLNSVSSIRFPTVFTGMERIVEITGEAYFEVAHNAARSFIVRHDRVSVQVFGTHFNVNTYPDEPALKVTLLEGSVRVQNDKTNVYLKPSEQAEVDGKGSVVINRDVNLEEVVAWKDGKFLFDQASISGVMHQISRWYDIDYEIRGDVSQHFQGMISRNVPLSRIMELLDLTGSIRVELEGKKLIVYSKN